MQDDSPIIATGATADGVTVFLHKSVEISNRLYVYRGRISDPAKAAGIFARLAGIQSGDIPAFLRKVKREG